MRTEELQAIDQAIEIISSGSVAGSAGKHLPGLVQIKNPTSLVQLRAGAKSPAQDAVASYLAKQGQKLHSNLLAALSLHVGSDPFVKIRKMIQDMITKLTEEAQEEAEHKGFCDSELASNKQTRDDKTTQADTLTANIEQMTAEAQKLATEIGELSADVAASDAAVAEATKIREEEKSKNTATVEDAKVAKAAVEKALQILKDFYEKAAGATAFIQVRSSVQKQMPETFDEPFTGTGGEGGVIGMLEVILSDFERLEAETTEEELTSQKEYETFMADSAEDKETKTGAIKDKTARKTALESDTAQAKKDLKSTNEELDAALAYFEKLKPSCVDAGESYEERVARRKEEIESLGEALKILEGESV
jgi:chromosome segregation ATPase